MDKSMYVWIVSGGERVIGNNTDRFWEGAEKRL